MTSPACLPLLASRSVPAARRVGAEARERGKRSAGRQPSLAAAEVPEAEWTEAAYSLFQVLSLPPDHPAFPSHISDLVCPAGARLALALLGLAEESAKDLADIADHAALMVELADNPSEEGPFEAVALVAAVRGDAYRRCDKPELAEAAFQNAFEFLAGTPDGLTLARVDDLYARLERQRGALDAAIEGLIRALGAYESAGALSAATDTAVRLASTLCEAGRSRDAESVCTRVRRYWPQAAPGAPLVREAAYLAARGRDAAVGQIQRIAEEGWMGCISVGDCRDLDMLRFERLAERFLRFGPDSNARLAATSVERCYAHFCGASQLFGTPEARSLHAMSQYQKGGRQRLPDDLAAALIYFVSSEPPLGPIRSNFIHP